jgi:hypothetical protein
LAKKLEILRKLATERGFQYARGSPASPFDWQGEVPQAKKFKI